MRTVLIGMVIVAEMPSYVALAATFTEISESQLIARAKESRCCMMRGSMTLTLQNFVG